MPRPFPGALLPCRTRFTAGETRSYAGLPIVGICGSPRLVDVGGPPYLTPSPHLDKIYSMAHVGQLAGLPGGFMIGSGAVDFNIAEGNCEVCCLTYPLLDASAILISMCNASRFSSSIAHGECQPRNQELQLLPSPRGAGEHRFPVVEMDQPDDLRAARLCWTDTPTTRLR